MIGSVARVPPSALRRITSAVVGPGTIAPKPAASTKPPRTDNIMNRAWHVAHVPAQLVAGSAVRAGRRLEGGAVERGFDAGGGLVKGLLGGEHILDLGVLKHFPGADGGAEGVGDAAAGRGDHDLGEETVALAVDDVLGVERGALAERRQLARGRNRAAEQLLEALCEVFELLWRNATPFPLGNAEPVGNGRRTSASLLSLLTSGLNDKAIEAELGMSHRTLARRIRELMKELGATTRCQLGWLAAQRSNRPRGGQGSGV